GIVVFLVADLKLDIGPMRPQEKRAEGTGELLNPAQRNEPGDLSGTCSRHKDGKVYHLLVPIGVLLVATVGSMFVTGAIASADNVTILTIFASTDVNLSLFTGGLLAVGTSFIFHIR